MTVGASGNNGAIEQLPISLQRWMMLERHHLYTPERFQDLSKDPDFDTRYLPQNSHVFELPCVYVRANHVQLFGVPQPDEHTLPLFVMGDMYRWLRLPVHPTALAHYRKCFAADSADVVVKDQPRIWAVPTSSTRTLLVWPDAEPEKARFVKTSLYSPLFGNRRLDARALAHSITLSQMVGECRERLPETVDYLPESIGMLARQMPDGGALIRSIPQQIKDGHVMVEPLFALLGGNVEHPPRFPVLLERSGLALREFVHQLLCIPVVELWLTLSLRLGIIIEAHAQDLLLQMSPDGRPLGRFIFRDFEGVQVDWQLRASLGLAQPTNMPRGWDWNQTYNSWGYRYGDLVWYKWRTSLNQYLHCVLGELEGALGQWHKQALIGGEPIKSGELTMMFSQYLMDAVENTFNAPVGAHYDLSDRKSMSRFLRVLMGVRRDILATSSPAATG